MKVACLFIFLLIFFKTSLVAQNDSLINDVNFKIKEGIYLNYEDFRRNDPVSKEQIESKINKDQLDFFGKIVSEETFNFSSGGNILTKESKSVWGFYQNNTLHIKYDKDFYRVPVFGSICYLVATVEVVNPGYYSPGYGGMMGGTIKTKEVRNFLMNFYNGLMIPFSMDEAENLLSRDPVIFAEYKSLKSRQRKEQVSRYIRKYNEAHPVYFLK